MHRPVSPGVPSRPIPPPVAITLDTRPLMDYLAAMTADFARQMAVTHETLVATQQTNAQLQATVLDMKSIAKTNEALLMQATTQNVNRVQFQQTMDKMTHRVAQLELALGLSSDGGISSTGKNSPASPGAPVAEVGNRLAQACKQEILRWAALNHIETRLEENTNAIVNIKEYLDTALVKLEAIPPMVAAVREVSANLADRITIGFHNSSTHVLQAEIQRGKDELSMLRRTVMEHSSKMNEIGTRLQDVMLRATEFTNNRIGLVYHTLCIDEDTDALETEMPEQLLAALDASGKAGDGAQAAGRRARGSMLAGPPGSPQTHRLGGSRQANTPPTAGGVGAGLGRSRKTSIGQRPLSDEEAANKQTSLLQSPMFLLFRQAILTDIADRVTSQYSSQSDDFGSEVLALRADIRQRATAQRVVELIKQFQDHDTPRHVECIAKRLATVEQTMVTGDFFSEALRTKADTKITDLKAEKTELSEASTALQQQIVELRTQVAALDEEREDLRAVSRELEAQVKRDAALRRLFPDGLRAAALGSTSASAMGKGGELDEHGQQQQQQGPHRQVVQPFLPAIVKLVPIEENLVSWLLPQKGLGLGGGKVSDGDSAPTSTIPVGTPHQANVIDQRQSVGSRANSKAAGASRLVQPHAPHVGTGNQTPVSRHNAAAASNAASIGAAGGGEKIKVSSSLSGSTSSSRTGGGGAIRTDNQESYAKMLEANDRAKAKTHPAIPYDL